MSGPHRAWLKDLKFDRPAQQTAFRGHLDVLADLERRLEDAARDLRRFETPSRFMSYLGLVPREYSSGGRRHTSAITKAGNQFVRRAPIESAWTYRLAPRESRHLQRKAADTSDYAKERACQAQKHLCHRYQRFQKQGKNSKVTVTAVARELAGFVWDIATHEMTRLDLQA